MRQHSHHSTRGSIALVMVLFIVAMITTIVLEIMFRSQVSATVVANRKDGEKAYELARAAIRWSIFRLQLDSALDKIPVIPQTNYGGQKDDLSEFQWAVPISYPFATESIAAGLSGAKEPAKPDAKASALASDIGGSFVSVLEDESSKINLNDVGSGGPSGNMRWSGASEVLENLLMSFRFKRWLGEGKHRDLLYAIDDWVDADDQVNHLSGGMEDAEYQTQDRDLHVKNSPFYSVEEVRLLKPMTEEIYRELKPFITVYPFEARLPRVNTQPVNQLGRINVNTAPMEIIAALFSRQAMPEERARLLCAQEIVKYRQNVVFRSPHGIEPSFVPLAQKLCGVAQKLFSPSVEPILQVRSDVFMAEGTGVVEDVEKTIRAVIARYDPQKPRILYWKVL